MTIRDALTTLTATSLFLIVGSSCASAALPDPRGGQAMHDRGGDYDLEVIVDGVPAPTFMHGGETYVLGQLGQRYTLRIHNRSPRRIEAVIAVDGRDAIDGKAADYRSKRGYLVPAWGQVDVDGWRISRGQAAAFRFSTVADSYAGRTGAARDVGVIGVAVFPERFVPPLPPPRVLETPPSRADGQGSASRAPSRGPAGDMAEKSAAPMSAPAPVRPGLGTEFGEAVSSPIREVAFVRANPTRPVMVLGVRYDDRAGLMAVGIDVDRWECSVTGCDSDVALRRSARPFPVVERRYARPPAGWSSDCCSP